MSRVVNVKGKVVIQNIDLAMDAINEFDSDIDIVNNQLVFNKYDAYDRINASQKEKEIFEVESLYKYKFDLYLEKVAEEERIRIEAAKKVLREEKADLIIAKAKDRVIHINRDAVQIGRQTWSETSENDAPDNTQRHPQGQVALKDIKFFLLARVHGCTGHGCSFLVSFIHLALSADGTGLPGRRS